MEKGFWEFTDDAWSLGFDIDNNNKALVFYKENSRLPKHLLVLDDGLYYGEEFTEFIEDKGSYPDILSYKGSLNDVAFNLKWKEVPDKSLLDLLK